MSASPTYLKLKLYSRLSPQLALTPITESRGLALHSTSPQTSHCYATCRYTNKQRIILHSFHSLYIIPIFICFTITAYQQHPPSTATTTNSSMKIQKVSSWHELPSQVGSGSSANCAGGYVCIGQGRLTSISGKLKGIIR